MKKITGLMILIAVINIGCSANLKMSNLKIEKSLKPNKTGKTAVVSSVNFFSGNSGTFSTNDDEEIKQLKKSIANAVYNSGSFDEVVSDEDEVKQIKDKKNIIYLDLKIYVIENGSFNWWLAWPGIYPLSAYWPLQPKKGGVAVNIEASASDESKSLKSIKGYGADNYDITFYGFFRTSPIEHSAEKAFLSAIDDIEKKFVSIDTLSRGGKIDKGVLVGSISEMKGATEIIIQHSEKLAPRMGELLYAMAGDKKIELIALFPMMTSTKCRIVKYGDYPDLKKSMDVFK